MPMPLQLTFDLESGVRVTCEVGYLCVNFSLPRPLCSRLRPDVRDRQTEVRQTDVRRASSLNAPYLRGGCITRLAATNRSLSAFGLDPVKIFSFNLINTLNLVVTFVCINGSKNFGDAGTLPLWMGSG